MSRVMSRLSGAYGPVVGLPPPVNLVCVSGYEAVEEALLNKKLLGRPSSLEFNIRTSGLQRGSNNVIVYSFFLPLLMYSQIFRNCVFDSRPLTGCSNETCGIDVTLPFESMGKFSTNLCSVKDRIRVTEGCGLIVLSSFGPPLKISRRWSFSIEYTAYSIGQRMPSSERPKKLSVRLPTSI